MGYVQNPYGHYKVEHQHHRNACWAAALSYWLKVTHNSNKKTQSQLWSDSDLKGQYSNFMSVGVAESSPDYGVLEADELLSLLRKSGWGMSAWMFNGLEGSDLQSLLASGPVVIGYWDINSNGQHVNVICGYDPGMDYCAVMEPRKYHYVEKPLSEYSAISTEFMVGWKV